MTLEPHFEDQVADWRGMAASCLISDADLTDREREFLGSIQSRSTLTDKQRAWLEKIAADLPGRDLEAIKEELAGEGLEALAESLLGPPNKETRHRSEWRWGAKGSAALVVRDGGGRRRGMFYTHEADQGGSPLDMIMFGRNCSLRDAIGYARTSLGRDAPSYTPTPISEAALQERTRKRAEQQREAERDADQKADYARRLHGQTEPVAGTVAERYLIETRGIPKPVSGWPSCVRFHPGSRSLLLAGTTNDGEVRSVQRIFLTPNATKIDQEELEARKLRAVKQTNGPGEGVAVRLPGDPAAPLLFAEGPETGLSAWVATGYETWIALGGLRKLHPIAGRRIVICRDDDKRFSTADKSLAKLLADWKRDGVDVVVATPWMTRRFDKSDLNDTIKAEGSAAVRQRIERAANPAAVAVVRQPIAEVRRELDRVIGRFFETAAAWSPELGEPVPVHAVKVDVGSGKSRAAYRYSAKLLAEMRARSDKRSIAFAVPTHKLADDQAEIFAAIAAERGSNVKARVWRGMEAIDPHHSDAHDDAVPRSLKTQMCRNLDAVRAAREAAVPVQTAACRKKEPGKDAIVCPFFHECGYQRQRQATADLWIVPHELLFLSKPTALGKLAVVIVDEASWSDGLEGVHGRPMGLAIDELQKPDVIGRGDDSGIVNHTDTDRLHFLRNRLVDGLLGMTDGPVTREALDGDLDHANAGEAYTLEWRRMVDPDLHPGLTPQERKDRVRLAAGNPRTMRLARVWKGVKALLQDAGPQASGWLSVATEADDKDGKMVRVLHLKGRKEIAKGWLVPTLLLDATMNIDLVRPYWPQVAMVAELLSTAPHQHVRQVVDRAFSKSMLDPLDEAAAELDPMEAKRRRRNLRTVHAILMREARRYAPERVLIVCQKAVNEALAGFGPMPPNVELAHHNAVAGRDEWGPQPERAGVRALIVVGRTMPTLGAVHRLAEALTGSAIEKVEGGWYGRGDATRERLDGRVDAIEADRHPDPLAEAIRWQICEGELVQIIGRGRGVNRTVENPLDVLIMTDAAVPVPVEETLAFSDLDPNPADLMMAAGGMVFENARHAAAAYPELWPSHNAADLAMRRGGVRQPCKDSISLYSNDGLLGRAGRSLASVSYQVAGAGQKPAQAACDLSNCPDPETFLTEKLGRLAWCKIEPQPSEQPTPPAGEEPRMSATPPEPAVAIIACCTEGLEPGELYPKSAGPVLFTDSLLTVRLSSGRKLRMSLGSDPMTKMQIPPWLRGPCLSSPPFTPRASGPVDAAP